MWEQAYRGRKNKQTFLEKCGESLENIWLRFLGLEPGTEKGEYAKIQ